MHPADIYVVIPTYNYAHFVCEAVRSVLSQTQPPFEIVVVDDGSKDNTAECLRQFGDSIRYVYQENSGLSAARNTGIREARGDWIAFLDSDDIWHPQKIERVAAILSAHPELCAIGSDMVSFSGAPPESTLVSGRRLRLRPIHLRDLVYGVHFSGGSGAVIRTSCFGEVGGFDEALRELQEYARLCPREPSPDERLGEFHSISEEPERALASYTRALEIDDAMAGLT